MAIAQLLDVNVIAAYLQVAMDTDPKFAQEVLRSLTVKSTRVEFCKGVGVASRRHRLHSNKINYDKL